MVCVNGAGELLRRGLAVRGGYSRGESEAA